MRKQTIRKHPRTAALILALGALIAGLGETSSRATLLTLSPPSQVAAVGDKVKVSVDISGLGNLAGPSLGAFDITLLFDSAMLNYEEVSFGPDMGFVFGAVADASPDQAGGTLNLFSVSLDSADELAASQPGEFMLAEVWFSITQPGLSSVQFSDVILSDENGNLLAPDALRGASISTETVVPGVPEGGLPLAGVGLVLAALSWAGRRCRGSFRR